MDKLSLYEILSFVIPGFILVNIIEFYNVMIFKNDAFFNDKSKLEESILIFCLSLFLGILIHILTFRFLKTSRLKWYKKLIFKTPQKISSENDFIKKVIPFLNQDYTNTRKHDENLPKPNEVADNLFDYAYLYLEVNDKITPAKNFQSMYFWFRNMFTIGLFLVPISLIIFIVALLKDTLNDSIIKSFYLFSVTAIITLVLIPTANWLREKLIEKVFWSYYVERVHNLNK